MNNQTLDPKEMQLLYQLKKELSLESLKQAAQLATPVLHALRQTLSLAHAYQVVNKLPDFLKLVFVTNWKQNEPRVPVQHLDEFVNLVMEREKQSKLSVFKNEVQTLSIVILTLKNLCKLIDIDSIEGFSMSLLQELRDVPAEAAA